MIPVNYRFFSTLYEIQNLEFNKHAPTEIPLSVLTIAFVTAIFCMDFFVVFYFSCHLQDDDEKATSGICHQFNEGELVPWLNDKDHITYVFAIMIFETFVFITFLVFRKPHDCFECLSINKKTRFSVFQFTAAEQERREKHAKEGDIVILKSPSGVPLDQ